MIRVLVGTGPFLVNAINSSAPSDEKDVHKHSGLCRNVLVSKGSHRAAAVLSKPHSLPISAGRIQSRETTTK
eukprot:6489125-Amphidinium_carterae.1